MHCHGPRASQECSWAQVRTFSLREGLEACANGPRGLVPGCVEYSFAPCATVPKASFFARAGFRGADTELGPGIPSCVFEEGAFRSYRSESCKDFSFVGQLGCFKKDEATWLQQGKPHGSMTGQWMWGYSETWDGLNMLVSLLVSLVPFKRLARFLDT